jgi:hypothetical protein
MSQLAETGAGASIEANPERIKEKVVSDYRSEFMYCIDNGGAISAEDALDCYLMKMYGSIFPEDELSGLRQAVSGLEQDLETTQSETYRRQRLDVYRELYSFGINATGVHEEWKKDLIDQVVRKLDALLLGRYLSLPEHPELSAHYKTLVYSYINKDNQEWLLPMLHRSFVLGKDSKGILETTVTSDVRMANDPLESTADYERDERLTPKAPEFLPLTQAIRRVLPRLRGH